MAVPEGHQPVFAQVPQDAVHVNSTQSKRVSQMILRERAIEPIIAPHAHEGQPRSQLQQKMCHPGVSIPPANPDEMFDHHRLIP